MADQVPHDHEDTRHPSHSQEEEVSNNPWRRCRAWPGAGPGPGTRAGPGQASGPCIVGKQGLGWLSMEISYAHPLGPVTSCGQDTGSQSTHTRQEPKSSMVVPWGAQQGQAGPVPLPCAWCHAPPSAPRSVSQALLQVCRWQEVPVE